MAHPRETESREAFLLRRRSYYATHQKRLRKQNKAALKRLRIKKRALVDALKIGKPCADCADTFPPICMDFDHVRGKKIASLTNLVRRCATDQQILEEIEKCELVCACCHRIRTQERRLEQAA